MPIEVSLPEIAPGVATPTAFDERRDECRCGCGALLARVVRDGLELKCRKCKRAVLISHAELVGMYEAQGVRPPPVLRSR